MKPKLLCMLVDPSVSVVGCDPSEATVVCSVPGLLGKAVDTSVETIAGEILDGVVVLATKRSLGVVVEPSARTTVWLSVGTDGCAELVVPG